jgi:hypothetical protein
MANCEDLLKAVVARLQSLPLLSGIPIIPEDESDIATKMNNALAQAGGFCIVVSIGDGRNESPANPTPSESLEVVVECGEIPVINRAAGGRMIPAIKVAVACIKSLHLHPIDTGTTLVFARREKELETKTGFIKHSPIFTTKISHT